MQIYGCGQYKLCKNNYQLCFNLLKKNKNICIYIKGGPIVSRDCVIFTTTAGETAAGSNIWNHVGLEETVIDIKIVSNLLSEHWMILNFANWAFNMMTMKHFYMIWMSVEEYDCTRRTLLHVS